MPSIYTDTNLSSVHSDDMQDIITTVPSWILRWGITLFFCVLLLIVGLSALIRYPDIVKATLKINSPNTPKPIQSKIQGKLVKILVKENENVKTGQLLAYIESTANHNEVINLLSMLKQIQKDVQLNRSLAGTFLNGANITQLGELQASYQTFFQEYLLFQSSTNNGFYLKKKAYLQKDLIDLNQQKLQINDEKVLQQRDYTLAEQEFHIYEKLVQEKAGSASELRNEESKYLAKKTLLVQTDASLVSANTNLSSKQKEILELENQIVQEKSKFLQALYNLISQIDDWANKYILTASQNGKLIYAGVVQENQEVIPNQEVFYINSGNEHFFGEMEIPQDNMGKVKEGQEVLVKLKGYPFEEYGMIRGTIKYIADVPYKDSVFMSKVDFKIKNSSDLKRPIHLKQGMMADAEIVTQDATILQRISRSFFKIISTK